MRGGRGTVWHPRRRRSLSLPNPKRGVWWPKVGGRLSLSLSTFMDAGGRAGYVYARRGGKGGGVEAPVRGGCKIVVGSFLERGHGSLQKRDTRRKRLGAAVDSVPLSWDAPAQIPHAPPPHVSSVGRFGEG